MGFFSKPNPARNPPGAEGLAHHRAIQMPNGRDDLPLKRAMGPSRSQRLIHVQKNEHVLFFAHYVQKLSNREVENV